MMSRFHLTRIINPTPTPAESGPSPQHIVPDPLGLACQDAIASPGSRDFEVSEFLSHNKKNTQNPLLNHGCVIFVGLF